MKFKRIILLLLSQRQRPCRAERYWVLLLGTEGSALLSHIVQWPILLSGSNPMNLTGIKIDEILCCHRGLQSTWFSWAAVTQSGNCSQKVRKLLKKKKKRKVYIDVFHYLKNGYKTTVGLMRPSYSPAAIKIFELIQWNFHWYVREEKDFQCFLTFMLWGSIRLRGLH